MPLVHYSLEIIRDVLRDVDRDPARTGKVLTLSYPDVICSPDKVEEIFGAAVRGRLVMRADGQGSILWHKAQRITRAVPDTAHLFGLLGYALTAVDLVEGRGGEVLHDLNCPLPPSFHDQYDLVFDCVSNQVFNAAQVFLSCAACCRLGGYVLHTVPVTMVNQGFWGVSPTTFHDFYAANGFEVLTRTAYLGVYVRAAEIALEPVRRMRNVPDDAMNVVLVRKTSAVTPRWPVMQKFHNHPRCQAAAPGESPL
jgi:hypothetical protein